MSIPPLSILFMGGIGLLGWTVARGFRSGVMHVATKGADIVADRRTSPRGFWINTAINVALMLAFAAYVIFQSGLSNT